MSDNLTKGRITKYTGWIKECGLEPPEVSPQTDLNEKEQIIKEFWLANKPEGWAAPKKKASKPKASKPKADKPQPAVRDLGQTTQESALAEILKAQQEEINALKNLIAGATKEPGATAGPEAFARAIEVVLKSQKDGTIEKGMVRPGFVPPDDVIEPVTFFTPQQNDYLSFRYEGGLKVLPPHDQPYIKFSNKFRWSVKSGNSYKVQAISQYVTRSKAEHDWIMAHPKFGNTIFLDAGKAIQASEHGEWAQQFNKFYASAMAISDPRLPAMAHQLGIPVSSTTPPDEYRRHIAEKQTAQYFENMRAAQDDYIADRERDKLLVPAQARP